MTALLQSIRQTQRRFDSLAKRERMLLIAAAAAIGGLAGDALWLTPASQRLTAARAQQRSAIGAHEALRGDLERLTARHRASSLQVKQDLGTWRERAREGEAAIRRYEDALVGPDHMLELLDKLLAERGQLRVRSMRTLPREDLLAPAGAAAAPAVAAASAPAPSQAAAPPPGAASAAAAAGFALAGSLAPPAVPPAHGPGTTEPSLYRHGVELTLEGGYVELLEYLRAVESMPQQLLWGGLQLKVEQYPVTVLTLRLYTISRDRHWLEI